MQHADDDTGSGLTADQAARRLLPWSPRLCLATAKPAAPKPKWLDSFAGRLHLAAEVMQQMQLQLDAEWHVQKLEHISTGKKEELQISHPSIPGRAFKSRAAVIAFLQALQQDGQPLPGVLDPIPEDVMKHRHYGDPAAAAAAAAASHETAAEGTADQLQQTTGLRTGKHAVGGDAAAATSSRQAAALATDAAAPDQQQQQQRRDRSQRLVAAALQRAQGRAARPAAAAAAAAADATLTDLAGMMEGPQKQPKYRSVSAVIQTPEQQPGKRKRLSAAAAAADTAAVNSVHAALPCNGILPDGRQPCPVARDALRQQIAAMVPAAMLDADWVVYPASHTPPRSDTCILHPSFPDGYFRSTRAVAAYLLELQRRIRKLGPGVTMPGLLPQQQRQQEDRAAAAVVPSAAAIQAAIQQSLAGSGRSYARKGPAMLAALGVSSGGGSSSGGQAAAVAAQPSPLSGPLDLLAAAAAAAVGEPPRNSSPREQQQQQQLLPPAKKPRWSLGSQQQQQQHGRSSSRPSSSAGSYTNAAAAAAEGALDTQLPDGRKPCGKTFALVQAQVSAKLPGIVLDHEWLIYAPQAEPPKMDTCIKHPCLPPGYFRSVRGFIQYLTALIPLIEKLGPCVAAPGIIHQMQPQRRQLLQVNGKPDRAVTNAIQQALKAAPGGFVWRGRGSSFKQKAATKLREKLLKQDAKQKDEQQQQQLPGQRQQQQQQQESSGSGASAVAAAAAAPRQKSSGAASGYPGGGYSGSGYTNALGGQLDSLPGSLQRAIMTWRHPPIDREYDFPPKGAVLVLGMVFASAAAANQAHAGMAHHRDRVRLLQLKARLGYKPHSFNRDDSDDCAHQGLHVQGNFNSMRGAVEVANRFPGVKFRAIFCDYFRFPTGYASEVYKPQLFTQFVPELIRRGAADPGVPIYVPNNPVLLKQLAAAGAFTGYAEVVALPGECYPLYKATELAQEAGELVGGYSNATEARQLPEGSEFVVMRCFADAPVGGSTLPPKPK